MKNIKNYLKSKILILLLVFSTMFLPKEFYDNLKNYYIIIKELVIQNKDIIPSEILIELKKIDDTLIKVDESKEKNKEEEYKIEKKDIL